MDLDNFISYDDIHVKLEKSSDHDISLSSPSLRTCESTPPLYPTSFSNIHNILSAGGLLNLDVTQLESRSFSRNSKPFRIIRTKNESDEDNIEVKIETEEKILNKSKLIMKREKAKQRVRTKLESPLIKLETQSFSEASETIEYTGKNRKKLLQMVRNRISAQNSRDRKKMYLNQLEESKRKLQNDTQSLFHEKGSLARELYELREANKRLQEENQELRMNFDNEVKDLGQKLGVKEFTQESFQDVIRKIINNSDPITQKLLSQNAKNLYNNSYNFGVFFSLVFMLYANSQNANTSQEGFADTFKGEQGSDTNPIQIHELSLNFQEQDQKSQDQDDFQSVTDFSSYNIFNKIFKSEEPSAQPEENSSTLFDSFRSFDQKLNKSQFTGSNGFFH